MHNMKSNEIRHADLAATNLQLHLIHQENDIQCGGHVLHASYIICSMMGQCSWAVAALGMQASACLGVHLSLMLC